MQAPAQAVVGISCLAIYLCACSLPTSALCMIHCGGPGLFVCSVCRVLPAQAVTSLVKRGSFQSLHGGIIACLEAGEGDC